VAETATDVDVDPVEEPLSKCAECFDDGFLEDESGLIKSCLCSIEPKLSRQNAQRAIAPFSTKNLPGSRSKTSTAHQLLELFKSSAHIIEDSPGVKTEATVSESAIAPATKNHLEEESDQNPILTGITLSDRFIARYSPPQAENIRFQLEADGQLSLLDFEVQSEPEPPDPDDFESLDAFPSAIARWDSEHCELNSVQKEPLDCQHCELNSERCELNSEHCKLNSVQKEPPDPEDFDSMFAFWTAYDAWVEDDSDEPPSSEDNDVSSEDKPLELSLDSFCLWAHCPADWYEPAVLIELSEVSELSPTRKTSITSDFFIPTFGSWGDRSDRSDEPPHTGIFARLPKPKPPNFPPQASQPQVRHKLETSWTPVSRVSRNYPETIPKLFPRVAAGSSTQPARSPPGGDAQFV